MDNPEFYNKEQQAASEPDFYGKWIPVSNLPKETGCYLVVCRVGSIDVNTVVTIKRFQKSEHWSRFLDGDWQTTTYWMPLPEPPKQKIN